MSDCKTQGTNVNATRILGASGTGKTQQIIDRICELLTSKPTAQTALDESVPHATANKILVLCATPFAADALRDRLVSSYATHLATSDHSSDAPLNRDAINATVNITTARQAALSLLASPEAIAWSGRQARLLTPYENLFLMEDMKVSGLRSKRLREMLKFFYRSWTELADEQDDWLLRGEESDVHELLKANLNFVQGYMEPEISNFAVRFLKTEAGKQAAHCYPYVFVDDYQMLSRASQLLAGELAGTSLTIAGDKAACVSVYDSYPYEAGLDEFLDVHPNASTLELTTSYRCPACIRTASQLLADDAMPTTTLHLPQNDENPATILENATPTDEFVAIAKHVAHTIESGTPASHIAIATPNAMWARNIKTALRTYDIEVKIPLETHALRSDVRDNARCTHARVLSALDLVADNTCASAWRAWCGFGDYLANSSAISHMRTHTEQTNTPLPECLKALAETNRTETHGMSTSTSESAQNAEDHSASTMRVLHAYEQDCALIEKVKNLSGITLLDSITEQITEGVEKKASPLVESLCLCADEDNSASAMAKRFREALCAAHLDSSDAVSIYPYDSFAGLSPDVLIISGFVNGFIPCRAYFDSAEMPFDKQIKEHAEDIRRVYLFATKANKQLVASTFRETDLETASRLKLKIDRIRIRDGVRICNIPQSDFVACMR